MNTGKPALTWSNLQQHNNQQANLQHRASLSATSTQSDGSSDSDSDGGSLLSVHLTGINPAGGNSPYARKHYDNMIDWYDDENEYGDDDWYQMDEGYYYEDDDEGMDEEYYEDLMLYEEVVRNVKKAEQLKTKAAALLRRIKSGWN